MDPNLPRERFRNARVARLATVAGRPAGAAADGPAGAAADGPAGAAAPRLVPVTFALLGDERIVTMVDDKPKRTRALARLADIAAHPAVALLVDHYEEDWSALWWARADGRGRVVAPGEEPQLRAAAVAALAARYPQYRARPPSGALIVVEVERWSGWSAAAR